MLLAKQGSMRSLVVTLIAGVALPLTCSAQSPPERKEHAVKLQIQGRKAIAKPDRLVVSGYGAGAVHRVTWTYAHRKTKLTFKDAGLIPAPACDDGAKKCTLTLPGDLLPPGVDRKDFKYVVEGEDDSGPLDPNDPWIEIDR